MTKEWYIIHTYSGYENKVSTGLEQRLAIMGLSDKVSQIIIPSKDVTDVRGGKKRLVTKKFFPGYVLIEMEMSDETWHAVRHTPGVFGFVGDKNKPFPLPLEDVENILSQMESGKTQPKFTIDFEVGESVRVIDGPFTDFIGSISEIDERHGKLKVMMNILGRATPVELEAYKVKKL